MTVPVTVVDPDYQVLMSEEDRLLLGLDGTAVPQEEVLLSLAMVTVGGGVTANLAAPVVIHRETRLAVQTIRSDHQYHWEHALPGGSAC